MVKKYVIICYNDLQNQSYVRNSNNYLDDVDSKIMELLVLGNNNKEIAKQM